MSYNDAVGEQMQDKLRAIEGYYGSAGLGIDIFGVRFNNRLNDPHLKKFSGADSSRLLCST